MKLQTNGVLADVCSRVLLLRLGVFAVSLIFVASLCGQSTGLGVDIVTRVSPLDGGVSSVLEKRNFKVAIGRTSLPFSLLKMDAQNGVGNLIPTFALLDLASCPSNLSSIDSLPLRARDVFDKAWELSVLSADGRQSPFYTSLSELDTSWIDLRSSRPISELEAIQRLSGVPGRHVVFKLCTRKDQVPAEIVQAANGVLAIVYAVYPQSREEAVFQRQQDYVYQTFNGAMNAVTSSTIFAGGVSYSRPEPGDLPVAEPSLAAAVQDALLDGRQYSELKVSQAALSRPLKLVVRISTMDNSRFRVETQAYSSGKTVPQIVLSVH